jgi:hypothetical protein
MERRWASIHGVADCIAICVGVCCTDIFTAAARALAIVSHVAWTPVVAFDRAAATTIDIGFITIKHGIVAISWFASSRVAVLCRTICIFRTRLADFAGITRSTAVYVGFVAVLNLVGTRVVRGRNRVVLWWCRRIVVRRRCGVTAGRCCGVAIVLVRDTLPILFMGAGATVRVRAA